MPKPVAARTSGTRSSRPTNDGSMPDPLCSLLTITRSPWKSLRTTSPIDALIDAPSTVNTVTTATPTMSAVAAPAVVRGLRIALRRASDPVAPRSVVAGVPSSALAGRATAGPEEHHAHQREQRTRTHQRERLAGRAEHDQGDRRRARPTSTEPRAHPRGRRSTSSVPSRIAASGFTREARIAGTRLAGTATATPTRAATASRVGSIASADDGNPNPAALINA